MKKRYDKKVVIITGASSGIGRATALEFAREGATTVLVSRSADKLEEVAAEIRALSGDVLVHAADVASPQAVEEMVRATTARFGRIDVLFNNAGTSYVGRIDSDNFVADLDSMIRVDLMGTVNVSRAVLPVMQRQGSGHIMNMSSVVGRKAFPQFGGYSSVMHAIDGFSDALRQELNGSGITVSTVHPALTQTPLLSHVDPQDMPPPFRRLTPLPVDAVARAVLDGIWRRKPRVIVPFQPRLLLFAHAISPKLGDRVVELLQNRLFGVLLGTYRGRIYRHG